MLGAITGTVGEPIVFEGYADDFDKAIIGVEFSLDEGETWTYYDTPDMGTDKLVTWRFSYTPDHSGRYRLRVRAVNENGNRSPLADVVDFFVQDGE
ncbi:MAG: molybdopterin-binding protein [Raoultibacter sp.]